MRISFRKSLITQTQRDRALFVAPIVIALILLFLFNQNKAVFASAWRSPMAVLAERSPGNRMAGALYNIKPVHEVKAAYFKPILGVPQERVLAASRVREPAFAEYLPAEATPLNLVTDSEPLGEGLISPLGLDLPPIVPFARVPPPRFPPSCCAPQLALAPPGISGPVPEPTTWMMNIVGLALVGGVMRGLNRKNRAAKLGSAQPFNG
jgi:hypothetical protein